MTHARIPALLLILALVAAQAPAQNRDFRIHTRGLLHETVYNTGEIGRAYDNGTAGVVRGYPSMEWPPNSYAIIDRTVYMGQHNSFGGGLWISGQLGGVKRYMYCGAVSDNNGNSQPVENIYSIPVSINRVENFPVLASGELNPSYDPNQAEETITAVWRTIDAFGMTVTRTSRAWSFPGYDSFIIYEYDLRNTTDSTISEAVVAFPYGLCPSMFGYERAKNRWAEADLRAADQFARFDLRRYLSYDHDRIGKPDTVFFNQWSQPGDRGGLNSPQAAGLMMLHFDTSHLALRGQTQLSVTGADTVSWDSHNHLKQPFLLRYENGNIYPSKIQAWLDTQQPRKTRAYRASDTLFFKAESLWTLRPDVVGGDKKYWLGRCRPSVDLGNAQPSAHGYGFGPYIIPPGDHIRFAVAEVVGYGPGVAADSAFYDIGGGVRGEPEPYLHPIASWYRQMTYANLGTPPVIGSNYLQTHPLPWYVTPGVVSIRDVADRAIEMYNGTPLVKHETVQYEPATSPASGNYATVTVPVPAPAIRIEDTRAAVNRIIWGPQVEAFNSARLHAPFKHYEAFRATHPLGPWVLIDSVDRRDPRYFRDSVYILLDTSSTLGEFRYYAVVSVDSLGGRSGMMTNQIEHETQAPAVKAPIGKVYVVPNPLIVTNGLGGSDPNGEVTDKVQFMGLTDHCTIRIFSYSGQLINTIQHDRNTFGNPWYQISRNNQILASGVYFFVVEDAGGSTAHGKFVVIH